MGKSATVPNFSLFKQPPSRASKLRRAVLRLPRPRSFGERDFENTLPFLPGLHGGSETMNLT